MFLAESSLLAVGGVIMGLILGSLLVAYFTHFGFNISQMGISGMMIGNTIYARLTMQDTVNLTILAFIITLLAGLYPAILAARLEPVQALRGGK
jgi:ABC-type lipoprotein release transport system permease subunit